MEIQNRETKKKYKLSRDEWNKMEKNQKLFIVIDESDEVEKPPQIIDNKAKPHTGDKSDVIIKDESKTNTKDTKKK